MADTIDPVTGQVVLNLITRTHVSRLVLQSLLTVLIRANPQMADMVIGNLERSKEAAREPQLREYIEMAIGEVHDASMAAAAK
jgi:hypothetical protein